MDDLGIYLDKYVTKLKKRYNYLNMDVIIIPSNLPGEGELKVFNVLQHFSRMNKHFSHLVVGNDADLIVMAMATNSTFNIDVMMHLQSDNYIISIKKLCELYSHKIHDNKLAYLDTNTRSDFCLLSIMNGNDYLPKLYYTNFDTLWDIYCVTKLANQSTLIINGFFNIKFLKDMMININNTVAKQFKSFNLIKFNPNKIKKYLEGLLWCTSMYTLGTCQDYSYMYEYNKGVSPIEIYYYLELHNINKINIPITQIKPLSTYSCMVLLLPKKMKCLLPEKLANLVDTEFSKIGLYEEEECVTCNNFKHEKNIKQQEYNKNKNDISRKEIAKLNGKLLQHRECHNNISLDMINKVINIVDNIK
jgi:5'-3' exonuclease